MEYRIYQVDFLDDDTLPDFVFRDYEEALKLHPNFNEVFKFYKQVYNDTIDSEYGNNKNHVLEELFRIFNCEIPDNYRGRSLSVSDIVFLDGSYYYCNSDGWEEIR